MQNGNGGKCQLARAKPCRLPRGSVFLEAIGGFRVWERLRFVFEEDPSGLCEENGH